MALRRVTLVSMSLAALFAASAASAFDEIKITGDLNIFISPSGKVYRAAKDKPYPVIDWFNAANAAHDGKLTKAEFRADALAFFHEADINKDGVIDSREVSYYEKITAPEIVAGFVPDTGRPVLDQGSDVSGPAKETPQGGAWFGLLGEPEPLAAADMNFDGIVTLDEFLRTTDERFKLLDVKKRGYITIDDLPMTPVQAKLPKKRSTKKR